MTALPAGSSNAMNDPWAYAHRQSLGSVSAAFMLAGFVLVLAKPVAEKIERLKEQTMEIAMVEPEPTPPPPVQPPQVQPPPTPPPMVKSTPQPTVKADPVTPLPTVKTPEAIPTPAAEPTQRAPAPPVVVAEPARPPSPPTPPAPSPAPSQPTAAQTDRYEAQILRYLESIKRYPSSREARQTRPSGVVTIWFELSRAGKVLDAGIENGSNSSLLDYEALKTVRSGNFPPFPDGVFGNSDKHRFSAHLRYELKSAE
jgi:periplasmic protein TonB